MRADILNTLITIIVWIILIVIVEDRINRNYSLLVKQRSLIIIVSIVISIVLQLLIASFIRGYLFLVLLPGIITISISRLLRRRI